MRQHEVFCRFCQRWIDIEDVDVKDVTSGEDEEDSVLYIHLNCNPSQQESPVRKVK